MFSSINDYQDTIIRKLTPDRKPGAFSLMEPGWWALHATAIAGVFMLGSKLRNRF